jgi:hypothetical protein
MKTLHYDALNVTIQIHDDDGDHGDGHRDFRGAVFD